jgi:protein-disulfide isomerase
MYFRALLLAASTVSLALPAAAQRIVPPNDPPPHFKDTSVLKLPPGDRVALIEFEDLECPACAHAAPIIKTAIEHYKIPYLRYDFPLQMHIWSRDAAITARYLQDKVNPSVAEDYRRDVFANQTSIASKDDLSNFTQRWFDARKLQMPFPVMDPSGRFAAEVQADQTLGERVGLIETPSIFVVDTKGWIQVRDITQLYSTIDNAMAESKPAATTAAAHNNLRKPKTAQN